MIITTEKDAAVAAQLFKEAGHDELPRPEEGKKAKARFFLTGPSDVQAVIVHTPDAKLPLIVMRAEGAPSRLVAQKGLGAYVRAFVAAGSKAPLKGGISGGENIRTPFPVGVHEALKAADGSQSHIIRSAVYDALAAAGHDEAEVAAWRAMEEASTQQKGGSK
jgi:hypothetical protein